jgi:hypothetical protein
MRPAGVTHQNSNVALISGFCASRELDTPLDNTCFRVSLMRKNSLSRLRWHVLIPLVHS